MSFVIQSVSLSLIVKYDKIKFNTNNHWINDKPPNDYRESLENTNTNKWINEFHDNNYLTIDIDDEFELNWMKKANEISTQTGKFTELYNDELELFLQKYEPKYEHIFDGTKYFVRSENVSMKYGQHKEGPYTNLKQIMESLVSSIGGHTPIYKDTTNIKLYLMPWINIDANKEFRVFVFNKKITAISQQNLYNILYENIPENELENLFNFYIKIIIDYFDKVIANKIELNNFTYDFAILDDDKPYFIESNSFGKEYAAGAALFGWINDEDILYQDCENPTVHFRYTIK